MGGSNSDSFCGLRFHVNDTEAAVHIHNDSSSMKFELEKHRFKKDVEGAFKQLSKTDGIVKVEGKTKTSFYVMKDTNSYFVFLADSSSVKSKVETFLKGI